MNSYSQPIADEMEALNRQGASIPENIIALVRVGRTDLGSMAVDNLKGGFDTEALSALSNLASREDYPEYWRAVDAAGGYKSGNDEDAFLHNMRVLASVFA